MKAVSYRYSFWPRALEDSPIGPWSVDEHISYLDRSEILSVRYDNGQLCTFRRRDQSSLK